MILKERISEEVERGNLRVSEIARKFKCSTAYVCNIKNGNETPSRLNVGQKIQIAYLWGADHCVTAISDKLQLTKLRVINFLKDEGLLDA